MTGSSNIRKHKKQRTSYESVESTSSCSDPLTPIPPITPRRPGSSVDGCVLFDMPRVRNKEFWVCLKGVAPEGTPIKECNSGNAIGVWCTMCEAFLPNWVKGDGHVARMHMESKHAEIVQKYCAVNREERSTNVMKWLEGKDGFSEHTLHYLFCRWIASSMRPYRIVEDPGFIDIMEYMRCCPPPKGSTYKEFGRHGVTTGITLLAKSVRSHVKTQFKLDGMNSYALTTDLWSSKTMEAYLGLTIHYVTTNFELRSFILSVAPVRGRHTGENIKTWLEYQLTSWNLPKENLILINRDGAANMKKACKLMNTNHATCIAHTLHNIVSPFLRWKMTEEVLRIDSEDEEDVEECADYEFSDELDKISDNSLNSENVIQAVEEVNVTVGKFRDTAIYIRNSTKAKEQINLIRYPDVTDVTRSLIGMSIDTKTRWNSAYDMLAKLLKNREHIEEFLRFVETPQGRRIFEARKFKPLYPNDWALIDGLCILLKPFVALTEALSGEQYPTFIHALSCLHIALNDFNQDALFNSNFSVWNKSMSLQDENMHKCVENWYKKYQEKTFFPKILPILERCKLWLLDRFRSRFIKMRETYIWITLLDPRQTSCKHLHTNELEKAKNTLRDNVVKVMIQATDRKQVRKNHIPDNTNSPTTTYNYGNRLFNDSLTESPISIGNGNGSAVVSPVKCGVENPIIHRLEGKAVDEIQKYLAHASLDADSTTDILKWWQFNKKRFPYVACIARQWLACTATSTPSERVFSNCGIVNSDKRTNILGKNLEDVVLIHRNMKVLDHLQPNWTHESTCEDFE